MLGRIKIRSHQTKHPIRVLGTGCPDFLAIDQEVISLIFGTASKACQIGPGAWLTVALAPGSTAFRNHCQMPLLLLLGTEFQQCRAKHSRAHINQRWTRANLIHLFKEHAGLFNS